MDQDAYSEFHAFVEARSPELIRRAYVLVGGDYAAAQDLVQASLAKVAMRWANVDEPIAYVRTVMYRQQISWWRRGWDRMETPSAAVPDRSDPDAAGPTELKLIVRAALRRLTPRQRAVLFLRYFEDLPETEVAATLGCSVGNVRSTTHRALAKLREVAPELAEFAPPPQTRHPFTEALT